MAFYENDRTVSHQIVVLREDGHDWKGLYARTQYAHQRLIAEGVHQEKPGSNVHKAEQWLMEQAVDRLATSGMRIEWEY